MRRFKYRSKIDVYVAISKAVRDGLIEAGVHPDSIRVIPSAIELERFDRDVDPLEVRRAWGLGPKEPLVVSVGSLTPEKDRSTLIEAAARLAAGARGFRLLVVGEGEERRKLAAGIARLGLGERVILCGFLEDPIPLLRAATVFVLSSRREGLGTALLEAAAAGLPAVATRVGGIPEIVEDGATGILVPPEDPEALAGALEELLGDPGRRASMGARARERARGFGAETMVEAVLGVYREASRWRRSGR
jgi:glycosyltransferase involved in cell wall biosynthesis